MKTWKVKFITFIVISAALLLAFSLRRMDSRKKPFVPPKGCVFRTVMGEESSDSSFIYKTPEKVARAVDHGLDWISRAQHKNGGWGAGSHNRQNVLDPNAVETDPATTAMVSMALLRSGNSLTKGVYAAPLRKSLNYLLEATENSPASDYRHADTNQAGCKH
jgi:hypothetical protein